MDAKVVLVTCPTPQKAEEIAYALVSGALAACVNVIPAITSIYVWEGKIEKEAECLMVIKTSAAKAAALEAEVLKLHPYTTPEFVVLEPAAVNEKYLEWLVDAVK